MIDDGKVAIRKAVTMNALTLVDGGQIEQQNIRGPVILNSGGCYAGFGGESKAW